MVKIKAIQKIISEWSVISGKSWETMYIAIQYSDIELANYDSVVKEETDKKKCGEQNWKVLYASHPTFQLSKDHPSIYAAVRKMTKNTGNPELQPPQLKFENDPTNEPVRFIELPLGKIPSAVFVNPGTILRTKSKKHDEKYVAILQTHVKKLLKWNPQFDVNR